ncbi:MAG: hypothetical protein IPQ09_20535 [Myxococcales bacterium]|nr:hypothetical protein [Myxococcales bacterium]
MRTGSASLGILSSAVRTVARRSPLVGVSSTVTRGLAAAPNLSSPMIWIAVICQNMS